MTLRLTVAGVVAVLAVAGCGGSGGDAGVARLWVTRDRGAVVMVNATIPAGQTLLRALRLRAKVDTRYGGRFVQGIDGVEGSLSKHRDWFWFVNGLAGDRSAAEYRLRAGDLAWWDYRGWSRDPELEVVVGAFPEPFLHGYGGRSRPAAVRYASGLHAAAVRIARRIRAASVAPLGRPVPSDANVFVLRRGAARFSAALRSPGGGPGSPVVLTFAGDVARLLSGAYVRRFAVP